METLWVDFQNAGHEGVRLICNGTLDELTRKNLKLYEGLKLIIWSNDEDSDGNIDNLSVQAIVKYSKIDGCWVASFDWNDLINESQRRTGQVALSIQNVPGLIGQAKVICYATIANLKSIKDTIHDEEEHVSYNFYGLAICKYEGESGCYLFCCNEHWQEFTDTWHKSIQDAKDQAEYGYLDVNWIDVAKTNKTQTTD